MIEYVEELGTELHAHALGDHRIFHQREIDAGEAGTGDDIAARIAEREQRVKRKRAGIEKLCDGMRAVVWIAAHIRAIVAQAGAALVFARQHRERLASLRGNNPADLPTASQTLRNRLPQILRARNAVNIVEDEAVANIEIREALLRGGVVIILRGDGRSVCAGPEEVGSAVDGFRIRVSGAKCEPVRELFIELHLQPVVIRTHRVFRFENLREAEVWAAYDDGHLVDVLQ